MGRLAKEASESGVDGAPRTVRLRARETWHPPPELPMSATLISSETNRFSVIPVTGRCNRADMSEEKLGYTLCEDCRGRGIEPGENVCRTCDGTGVVAVFAGPPVVGMPLVESPFKRRRFPRYYADLPLKLRNQQEQAFVGRCVEIAEGGFGSVLPYGIPVGSEVTAQVSIPTLAIVLSPKAMVRNQKGLRHGFEFALLTTSERAAIRQFCSGLMVQSDDGRVDS